MLTWMHPPLLGGLRALRWRRSVSSVHGVLDFTVCTTHQSSQGVHAVYTVPTSW